MKNLIWVIFELTPFLIYIKNMKITMEVDELLKKMSNLCDLNTDLQVGPILVYWQTIGLISQEQHLTLSVLKVLQCIVFLYIQVQIHSFDAILSEKDSVLQEVSLSYLLNHMIFFHLIKLYMFLVQPFKTNIIIRFFPRLVLYFGLFRLKRLQIWWTLGQKTWNKWC